MTCRSHRDAILDLARGVPMPAAVEDAAHTHIRTCTACAAELVRQRDLTQALRVLSAGAGVRRAPAGLEDRLLAAFPAQQPPSREPVGRGTGVGWWLGIAAAVSLIAVGVWSVQRSPELPADAGSHGIARNELPAKAGSHAVANDELRAKTGSYGVATDERPAVPGSHGLASSAATVKTPGQLVPAPSRANSPARPIRPVRDVEFVAIPTAVGLPPLESATIVRTELPLSALPEYGLQISSHAAHAAVQADLLVGQDGVPRGIRLVSALEDQVTRSRQ